MPQWCKYNNRNDTYIEKTLGDKLFNVWENMENLILHDWYKTKKMNFSYYLLNKNSYYFGEQGTEYLGDLYEDLAHTTVTTLRMNMFIITRTNIIFI